MSEWGSLWQAGRASDFERWLRPSAHPNKTYLIEMAIGPRRDHLPLDPLTITVGPVSRLTANACLSMLTSTFAGDVNHAVDDMSAMSLELESLSVPITLLRRDGGQTSHDLPGHFERSSWHCAKLRGLNR